MKLIIRKINGFGNTGLYQLEDEYGNIRDNHVCSDDEWAKKDLLSDKPEYKDAEIEFIDNSYLQVYIDNQSEHEFCVDHIGPQYVILPYTARWILIDNDSSRLLFSEIGAIEVINEDNVLSQKTMGNILVNK